MLPPTRPPRSTWAPLPRNSTSWRLGVPAPDREAAPMRYRLPAPTSCDAPFLDALAANLAGKQIGVVVSVPGPGSRC